jgi:thiol-disulfide isomerase/thioredoxin
MRMKLFKIKPLLSVILAALLVSLSQPLLASAVEGAAADFTLKSKAGSNIRLQELRGEVVLLNFWASWCGPCREEMPLMDKIYKQYKDLGFTILAVNVDEDPADADRFLASVPVSFPVLYDSQSKVSELYKVDAMPTTILIDRDGNKRFLHRGYKVGYEDQYEQQVKQLVRE